MVARGRRESREHNSDELLGSGKGRKEPVSSSRIPHPLPDNESDEVAEESYIYLGEDDLPDFDLSMPRLPPSALNPETSAGDFRLLIGIMSPFWAFARRQIIRHAYSRFPKTLPVDIFFVEGIVTASSNEEKINSAQQTVVDWENSTFHDIMHLDCKENMNEGKTYEFLKKVGNGFGNMYTHVLKTDDDAFINIPGSNLPTLLFPKSNFLM